MKNKNQSKSSKSGKYLRRKEISDEIRSEGKNIGKEVKYSKSPLNDPTWYQVTPVIGEMGASIPYNVFNGTLEDLGMTPTWGEILLTDRTPRSTPGVMGINYLSVIGTSDSSVSAINTAAKSIYSFVRHKNSGHTNYESADLMLYICAMAQVYAYLTEGARAYRLAQTFDAQSRIIPDTMLQIAGFDPANLRDNLAQFLFGLNLRIVKASQLLIPKQFKLFERQSLLASIVLSDSSSIRSQFYIPHLDGVFRFDATGLATGGSLVLEQTGSWGAPFSVDEYFELVDKLLDPLLADEDINIMSGDILKAYELGGCYTLNEVPIGGVQSFVYDEDLLNQVENMYTADPFEVTSATPANLYTAARIYQEEGFIRYTPGIKFSYGFGDATEASLAHRLPHIVAASGKRIFNSHKDNPTWKDNLEWSRLTSALKSVTHGVAPAGGASVTAFWNVGTELVTSYSWAVINYNNSFPVASFFDTDSTLCFNKQETSSLVTALSKLSVISAFDWHPQMYLFVLDSGSLEYSGCMYDSKVHTLVDNHIISRLNDLAVMGVFLPGNSPK